MPIRSLVSKILPVGTRILVAGDPLPITTEDSIKIDGNIALIEESVPFYKFTRYYVSNPREDSNVFYNWKIASIFSHNVVDIPLGYRELQPNELVVDDDIYWGGVSSGFISPYTGSSIIGSCYHLIWRAFFRKEAD